MSKEKREEEEEEEEKEEKKKRKKKKESTKQIKIFVRLRLCINVHQLNNKYFYNYLSKNSL